jgi:hypothetical protein
MLAGDATSADGLRSADNIRNSEPAIKKLRGRPGYDEAAGFIGPAPTRFFSKTPSSDFRGARSREPQR